MSARRVEPMNGICLYAIVATMACMAACDGAAGDQRGAPLLPAQDSVATALELRASLSGGSAPGAQSYSFRGLYAGMTRALLEGRAPLPAPGDSACRAAAPPSTDLTCSYRVALGSDSALVSLDVQYGGEQGGERVARVVTISRDLPLDVDGVQLARVLADAFADQTALLDKRDASYGRHQAQVRMGTVSGAHKNYVELTVVAKGSREVLTVKMSRL